MENYFRGVQKTYCEIIPEIFASYVNVMFYISDGLEHFCQPNGWRLYTSNFEPKFFISVLTDEQGRRHYCACLTFSEAISRQSIAGAVNHGKYEQGNPLKSLAPTFIILIFIALFS